MDGESLSIEQVIGKIVMKIPNPEWITEWSFIESYRDAVSFVWRGQKFRVSSSLEVTLASPESKGVCETALLIQRLLRR
jgi:hypothetical protein